RGIWMYCLDCMVWCVLWLVDIYALRVDAHNHGLLPVCIGYQFYGCGATQLLTRFVKFLGCNDSIGTDTDFVRARFEVHGGHIKCRKTGPICVGGVFNTTSDCQ